MDDEIIRTRTVMHFYPPREELWGEIPNECIFCKNLRCFVDFPKRNVEVYTYKCKHYPTLQGCCKYYEKDYKNWGVLTMEESQPETTLDRAIRWNIHQIEEKMDSVRVYKENLEKIFSKEFNIGYCQINTNREQITVTLQLLELTHEDIRKLNEIADEYIIEPSDSDVVSLQIFQFKGMVE